MAMDGDILGALIKSSLDSMSPVERAIELSVYQELASTIIQHIQTAGVIATTVTVPPGIPVLVAFPAGTGATTGPGAGTGVGTIT